MNNKQKIAELQKDGFKISHATFYRYKRNGIITNEFSLKKIKVVLRRIERLKTQTIDTIKKD